MTPASPRFALARLLRVGIAAGTELDGERRADKREGVAEVAFEVALVGIRHPVERVAVDDDARRIDAALMRVAQLGADQSALRRRLPLDCRLHRSRELRRWDPRHGGGMRRIHGAHERTEALRILRRDEVRFGEVEEAELPLQLGL